VTYRLIFVCEANVCRSPLMEIVMRAQPGMSDWRISSAGTRVGPGGLEICQVSASIADAESGNTAKQKRAHRSQALDADALRSADLILTASRAERSAVAALVPEVRSRMFTLREAVHLGAEPVQERELELLAQLGSDADDLRGVRRYARALHARRGFVTLPAVRRTLFGARRRNPYDIADAHHGSDREHEAMLRATVQDVKHVHGQLDRFLEGALSSVEAAPRTPAERAESPSNERPGAAANTATKTTSTAKSKSTARSTARSTAKAKTA